MLILKGQPIVRRIAFGHVRVLSDRPPARETGGEERVRSNEAEETRLRDAVSRLKTRLEKMHTVACEKLGSAEADIFQVHFAMLDDPVFQQEVLAGIRERGQSAEASVRAATELFRGRYDESPEEKIRSMASELAGLAEDLLVELESPSTGEGSSPDDGPSIVLAREVTPGMVMRAEVEGVAGFVAKKGGLAAHATILARALDVPFIVNVNWTGQVNDGDRGILDGTAGSLVVNPTEEEERLYREARDRLAKSRLELLANRELPSATRDGCVIHLEANIGMTAEAEALDEFGAEGVGLYRSELSYLLRNQYPSEDELFAIYRNLGEHVAPRPMTVRTLDVGGEKTPAYFHLPMGRNPLLGLRSTRLLHTHRQVLQTQFRAILRAAEMTRNLRVMFPFIASFEEWTEARQAFEEAKEQLRETGSDFRADAPLGLMVELPSAALSIRTLLAEADFTSIGTNDLTQYILGVDRGEPQVASLYQPVSPPMLELIGRVAEAGRDLGKPVSLCGEMAGDPRVTPLLVGLGLRTLSMNAEAIPAVKDKVRSVSLAECEELARTARAETTVAGIARLIDDPD